MVGSRNLPGHRSNQSMVGVHPSKPKLTGQQGSAPRSELRIARRGQFASGKGGGAGTACATVGPRAGGEGSGAITGKVGARMVQLRTHLLPNVTVDWLDPWDNNGSAWSL
jgi:hypothetical protein